MKSITHKLRTLALAAGTLAVTATGAQAAQAGVYAANDLLMFFRNPGGPIGANDIAYFNLGSTYNVFRAAATPDNAAFNTVISLGNINNTLITAYGNNWATTRTIFGGAAGQNGSTSALSDATSNGDFARTTYVTKPRTTSGDLNKANSSSPLYDPSSTGTASAISGGNNISGRTQPGIVANSSTTLDTLNPITLLGENWVPGTSYGAFQGGIVGAFNSSTYNYGSISNIVLGLDLYRVTQTTGDGTGNLTIWQTAENIANPTYTGSFPGGSTRADYLGTITLSDNGDVNFTAVPEPSTYALLALAAIGLGAHVLRRRHKQS